MGLSRGNLITIGLFSIGILGAAMVQYQAYGQTLQQVQINKENIEKLPEQFKEEIKESEQRLAKRMDALERRSERRDREQSNDIKQILRALK